MQTDEMTALTRAYIWLTVGVTAMIFVQAGLIGAFLYKPVTDSSALAAHGDVGVLVGFVAILPFLITLRARFPRELRLGWWTFAWALLWNVQSHVVGFGIEDERWWEIIHIPVALLLLAWGMVLAHTAHRASSGS
jgi:hypothetical protein